EVRHEVIEVTKYLRLEPLAETSSAGYVSPNSLGHNYVAVDDCRRECREVSQIPLLPALRRCLVAQPPQLAVRENSRHGLDYHLHALLLQVVNVGAIDRSATT